MEKHVSMRVLIVTHNYLSGFGGGAYGARAYINAFAALYDDITLLFPAHSEDESIPEIAPHVRMKAVTDTASKVRKAVRQVFRGVLHRFERPFSRLMETDRFDMVVFQNSKCSSRLIRKARKAGARTVVIHDNYEWEYTRDNTPLLQLPLFLLKIRPFQPPLPESASQTPTGPLPLPDRAFPRCGQMRPGT